ncbi:MAG: M23 family metallopeptidase [Patescibacteria group bacterium]
MVFTKKNQPTTSQQDQQNQLSPQPQNEIKDETIAPPKSSLVEPTPNFIARITKKPFGIYVTPRDSPVAPEHFTGYHTGADSEYDDVASDVVVNSIADGEVVLSRTAQGYGGVMVIRHLINHNNYLVLYGHLEPKSMLQSGQKVSKGDKIGILGDAFTSETDNERKHLHLAILKGERVDLRGYVQDQSQLDGWYNPKDFLEENFDGRIAK